MKKISISNERTSIEINGTKYDVRQSDGEVYHNGRNILLKCLTLKANDSEAVLSAIKEICGTIDDALGAGAMEQIAGDTPVSLPFALKVLNAVLSECGERYTEYINSEYLGGGNE